jgi:hypothetical protein
MARATVGLLWGVRGLEVGSQETDVRAPSWLAGRVVHGCVRV